ARLRVTIAPLNSASYQKNYNTGGRIGYERTADARVAHIRVFHDRTHPSVLSLPLAAPWPSDNTNKATAVGKDRESRN
ncbi:MAG TPA: hypothetical protein VJ727_09100, partial [Rhodanobacteraceae bacterium]|nr:hypothetical protein [Rhodanobacteraceae bacterium]